MKSRLLIIIFIVASGIGLWFFAYRDSSKQPAVVPSITPPPSAPISVIPTPVSKDIFPEPEIKTDPTPAPLPARYVLDEVQFASQAPTKSWAMPYQEFCEESSVLIAAFYALGKSMPANTEINTELFRIKSYEEKTFGYYADTTAEQTSDILKDFYKLTDVTLIKNPSVNDIKTQIVAGNAIIVPTAGRMLAGPFYHAPGPLYHMLVLKGYTADGYFITQDPGTNSKGENFKFKISVVMNAMHDWNDGDVQNGQRVVIIVGKNK